MLNDTDTMATREIWAEFYLATSSALGNLTERVARIQNAIDLLVESGQVLPDDLQNKKIMARIDFNNRKLYNHTRVVVTPNNSEPVSHYAQ